MKCPNCGQEMNDNAVFCISCGQRLTGIPQQVPQKKDRTPLIIGLGVLAIILIIGVACVLLLNPFDSKDSTDPYAYLSAEPDTNLPQSTEAPAAAPPSVKTPELPANARPINIPEGDHVGLPVPDVGPEVLQAVAEQYWKFLGENGAAQEYALIDFLGDELPELIVRERMEDGDSCYSIYYFSGDDLRQIVTAEVTATSDARLLSIDGTLMVAYGEGFVNCVIVDKNLKASVKLIKTDQLPVYTDSALQLPVSDRSLLDLHLLGKRGKFSGEGWIRINGTDYYYKYGKPCVNQWIEEEDCLYYLGSRGCITQVASQSMLSDVMNAYFASYQAAFNKKDASLLIYATDKNREEEQKRFQTEENKYLTISDLTCETTLHKGKDSNGTMMVDVHLEYTQTGEWENAEKTSGIKDYRITLTWIDGMWHVDHIGNR